MKTFDYYIEHIYSPMLQENKSSFQVVLRLRKKCYIDSHLPRPFSACTHFGKAPALEVVSIIMGITDLMTHLYTNEENVIHEH